MLSRKLKILAACGLALLLILGGSWLARKYAQGQTDKQVEVLQAERAKAVKEALDANGRAAQLAQEVERKNLELTEATQRAELAEARLTEARTARIQLQRVYEGERGRALDQASLAAPITKQEASQLCRKLKDLNKLPESFQCP